MKKFTVQWAMTERNTQPMLFTLSDDGKKPVFKFETTDLEEANEFANNEILWAELEKISDLNFDPTDEELRKYGTHVEIIAEDTEDEDAAELVDFDSPLFWFEM